MPGITNQQTTPLNLAATLVSTTGALQQTLLTLAACHGNRQGPWLDQLEASMIRNTKNMTFTGTGMEAEAAAVEAALANLKPVFGRVRQKLQPAPNRPTITIMVQRKES